MTEHDPYLSAQQVVDVLIVEDQRFDRERLTRFCRRLGRQMQISSAATLARAADMIADQKFDLIFLDFSLPDGTGLDAMEMIRLSEHNCTAATIMITGQGMEGLAAKALRHGCSDYIAKADLNTASFTRAATNALQKSHLTRDRAVQTVQRQEIEAVLQRYASDCARDIKPMVSRMMRQVRSLRDGRNPQSNGDALEKSCMLLWDFLVDLESHSGADLAAEVCLPPPVQPATSKGKPRPSLFGRA